MEDQQTMQMRHVLQREMQSPAPGMKSSQATISAERSTSVM